MTPEEFDSPEMHATKNQAIIRLTNDRTALLKVVKAVAAFDGSEDGREWMSAACDLIPMAVAAIAQVEGK